MKSELLTALEEGDVTKIQESFDRIMLNTIGTQLEESKKEIAKTLFTKEEE